MPEKSRGDVVADSSGACPFRPLRALSAACLLWLGIGAPHAAADEIALRAALKAEALQLLERGDLATFDRRATEMRRTRERTPAGIWKLSLFYYGVEELPTGNPTAPIWSRVEKDTDDYLQAHPDSPSAVVAAARVRVAHAWAYRTDKSARQVGSTQWAGFADWLERARVILDAHREVGKRDPDWYAQRILVMNGQGDDKTSILALAMEALDGEPTYQPTYYVTSTALLPKWGGSARLLQQYLAAVLARTQEKEGRQAYGRIAFNIARYDAEPIASLGQVGIRWPAVKESLEEITAAYPDDWNRNAERAMACLIGTEEDFDSSSSRAGPRLISVVWFDSLVRWQDCRQRQQRAGPVTFETWLQKFVSASPSPYLAATVSGAVLLALFALYSMRRRGSPRGDAVEPSFETGAPQGDADTGTVYRATAVWRFGQTAAGIFMSLAGIAGVWEFGAVAEVRDTSGGLVLMFVCALLASAGAMMVMDTFVSKVVLRGSTLEIVELWRTRRIRREDVASRQTIHPPRGPAQLVLRFKDPARRAVKLPLVFSLDTQFDAWLRPIPDADAMAAAALDAEIQSAPELGSTPEERLATFERARRYARYATFAAPALFLWSALYPRPYPLIIGLLAVLPWVYVGLMAKYPGVYQLNGTAGAGRPDLSGALIPVGALLALRAFIDVHTLDWRALTPWAVGIGALLAVSIVRVNRSGGRKWGTALVILLVSGAYGYGAAMSANAVLDTSAPTTYRPSVLRKHVSGGRNRTYELLVDPWGARKSPEDVTVPAAVFNEARVGEPICIAVHGGALGSRWYHVSACDLS